MSNGDDVTEATSNQEGNDSTVLGLRWDKLSDEFVFDFKVLLEKCRTMKETKRGLLSAAASIFDPLGMVAL